MDNTTKKSTYNFKCRNSECCKETCGGGQILVAISHSRNTIRSVNGKTQFFFETVGGSTKLPLMYFGSSGIAVKARYI